MLKKFESNVSEVNKVIHQMIVMTTLQTFKVRCDLILFFFLDYFYIIHFSYPSLLQCGPRLTKTIYLNVNSPQALFVTETFILLFF